MKFCPQCHSSYSEDQVFCFNDGAQLRNDEVEQETVVQKKVSFGQETVALPNTVSAGGDFTPEGVQPSEPFMFSPQKNREHVFSPTDVFQTPNFIPPPSGQNISAGKSNRNLFLIIGALLGALIIGAVGLTAFRPNSLEKKLDKAISANRLFEPEGDNAYELYRQLKNDGADSGVLKKYEDRVFPMLTETTTEIFNSVTDPAAADHNLSEWQLAAKRFEWASEIRPQDGQLAAKAAYAKGRVNYLTENRQAALDDWKKAADLDKKWALPLNGIGLVYNEFKNYDAARTWLRKAIDIEPTWAIPYNNFGTSFYYQKRYSESVEYYRKAAELSPRWARPRAWLGSVAKEMRDYSTCAEELGKVFAPDAIGTASMELDKIRKVKVECENQAAVYSYGY